MSRALLGAALLLSSSEACSERTHSFVGVVGPINTNQVEMAKVKFNRIADSHQKVVFGISYSPGGDARSLLKLVELVNRNADSVFVSGDCLSACAEFLYLINKPIATHRNAAIGFHGNALTEQELSRRFKVKPNDKCTDWAYQFSAALQAKGIDPKTATDQTIRRLEYYKMRNESSAIEAGCITTRSFSRHRFWFPSSRQLRTIFGLKIGGEVCADNPDCITQFAKEKWGSQADIVVADQSITDLSMSM